MWVQQEDGVILNNGQPTDQIVTPTQETPITPKPAPKSRCRIVRIYMANWSPEYPKLPFMHEFTNKPTLIGQLFKEADSSD